LPIRNILGWRRRRRPKLSWHNSKTHRSSRRRSRRPSKRIGRRNSNSSSSPWTSQRADFDFDRKSKARSSRRRLRCLWKSPKRE
jgi:hypothetical protein